MNRRRMQTWVSVGVVGAGCVLLVVAGLVLWVTNPEPLHLSPDAVPTTRAWEPEARWQPAVAEARRAMRAAVVEQRLPGVSVAVGLGADVVWAEGMGWADLEDQVPVSPTTRFRIGTTSMALTSAGVGLLLEEGRLRLDDEIRRHVPAYPEKDWPVTLRHLLSHTSGVRNDAGDEGPFDEHCAATLDGLRLFEEYPLLFEPGTRFRTSSFGWVLVSAAMEAASGEPFPAFMRDRVFEPLAMRDTRPDAAGDGIADKATSYFPRFAADPRYGLHLTRPIDYSCYAGANVFVSTPSDLVRFGLGMADGRLLRPDTVSRLQTSQRLTTGEETGYGLGWEVRVADLGSGSVPWVGHSGTSMGGMVSSLVIVPGTGLVVAVTSNIAFADTEGMALAVARAFQNPSSTAATSTTTPRASHLSSSGAQKRNQRSYGMAAMPSMPISTPLVGMMTFARPSPSW